VLENTLQNRPTGTPFYLRKREELCLAKKIKKNKIKYSAPSVPTFLLQVYIVY
jgi:hypothetical protein